MRRLIMLTAVSAGLLIASPALAKNSQKFQNSFAVPVDSVRIEVTLSEDMEWRANNLPKDRRERGQARNSQDGFGGNGYYGERDLERLVERLEKKLTQRLEKEGVVIDPSSTNVLRITLDDARPTHPTFTQMSRNAGLSHRSVARGGASFVGELIANNGEAQGEISYAWYENNICSDPIGATWNDSKRAIDRFAKHTAKSLSFK